MLMVSRTHIALKILKYLAMHHSERVTTTFLSEETGIPRPYLRKVANQLIRAGIIRSVRGYYGHVTLARPASQIRLGEVWAVIEDTRDAKKARGDEVMPPAVMKDAVQKFLEVLNEHTLEDIPAMWSDRCRLSTDRRGLRDSARPGQYRRINPTKRPWMST